MRNLPETKPATASLEDAGSKGPGARKILLLVAVGAVVTVLFLPSLVFMGRTYLPGDVALRDVKSPVAVSSGEIVIRKGETIVRDGQVITEADVRKLALVEGAVKEKRALLPATGFFVFTVVFLSVAYYFSVRNIRKFQSGTKDLVLMAVVLVGVLSLVRFTDSAAVVMKEVFPLVPVSAYKFMVPVAIGPMLVRLLLNSETAVIFAVVSSVTAGFFMGEDLELAAYALIGGLAAAAGVRHCTHRSIVIKAGLVLGAVNAVTLLAISALKGGVTLSEPVFIVVAGLLNGVITAVLAIGIAPVFEAAFQYTTNIKLLELSRMDHPLLKELAVRAPGTYHHSIVIGTLVEAAAESINANPLLARVSAYYHDIGKLRMPQYYIENTSGGENRHDGLDPSMSALVISSHIREGVELAREHRLGKEITDVISQHHGTSIMTYFYQKAKSREGAGVNETDYRYPGPKPQTREAGLVMLADAIEAASKTLPEPTPERIESLTQKIVGRIFSDGQLDECELTLKDLHSITSSFNRALTGIHHQRIDYPEPVEMLKEERSRLEDTGERSWAAEEAQTGTRPEARDDGPGGSGGGAEGGRGGLKRLGAK